MAESQNVAKVIFLPDQEEILIEEVRNHPVLYDLSKSSHKDIIMKDNIWKNISIKVRRSGKYKLKYLDHNFIIYI